jgi:hypothetical protein
MPKSTGYLSDLGWTHTLTYELMNQYAAHIYLRWNYLVEIFFSMTLRLETLAVDPQIWVSGSRRLITTFAFELLADSFCDTNIGNVTYACPGFHALFGIPAEASIHTREFTDAAGTREAHELCLNVAAGMAAVAYDILTDDEVAARVQLDFDNDVLQR